MLAPSDWAEWEWFCYANTGNIVYAVREMRVWRITATAGGATGTITIQGSQTVTVPANTTYTLEPRGMLPLTDSVAFAGLTHVLEVIRRTS